MITLQIAKSRNLEIIGNNSKPRPSGHDSEDRRRGASESSQIISFQRPQTTAKEAGTPRNPSRFNQLNTNIQIKR